ncbi:MAG: hypothetical protein WAO98_03600 [Alphaproteobacteria bacterium]
MPFTRLFQFILLLSIPVLTACSTPSEMITMNDGTRAYRITCGGPISSVKDCFERAGYICGNKGYTVVRETDITPPSDSNYFWNAAAHETIVKCNLN